jgi:hypothetical protein
MKKILFEKPYARISFETEKNYLWTEWDGFTNTEKTQEVMTALLAAIKETQASNMLGDHRKWQIVQQVDQDWITEVWFPQAIEAGFRKFAEVISESIFNQLAVSGGLKKVSEKTDLFRHRHFSKVEEAESWLCDGEA